MGVPRDTLNRLSPVDYPNRRRFAYGYDPVANRVSLVDTLFGARWAATATSSSRVLSFACSSETIARSDRA